MTVRIALCVALAVSTSGCGVSQARLDEAQALVQQGLELWKKGGHPSALMSGERPVEFHEALWNDGNLLVSYEAGEVSYHAPEQVIRCATSLVVRTRRGQTRTENVVYEVHPGSPVKIVNNPMP